MPPKELSPEEREQVRREKADMKAEILKLTHVWWKLDMEHSIELAMQLSMFWIELEDVVYAWARRHCAHIHHDGARVDAQNRHHLVMDVTLLEAIEPDNTALGRSVRETDCMVTRSMMEGIKDPAFNQVLNSILLDTTKPRGRKTAHCLIFICSKLETKTFVQIFMVMQAYLRVRQLSTESLRTYGERCRAAIRDVQDAFTERNQPTDWEAIWKALTTGLMFMNARQDFRDVALQPPRVEAISQVQPPV